MEKDPIWGIVMVKYLAMIAAWAGDKDLACEQLAIAIHPPRPPANYLWRIEAAAVLGSAARRPAIRKTGGGGQAAARAEINCSSRRAACYNARRSTRLPRQIPISDISACHAVAVLAKARNPRSSQKKSKLSALYRAGFPAVLCERTNKPKTSYENKNSPKHI